MSSKLLRFAQAYFWHLVPGALLLAFADVRWFLFYLFFEVLICLDFLRKMVRVFQSVNDVRFIAVMRKLKITDDDLSIVADSMKTDRDDEKFKSLEREMRDLL